ncbi:hypothetical protein B591_10710 [Streptomyces sp. GBA 94-10 4N24]|nr:hypothetical protein B591_10710 [Streptomyces sp. GBA 94-10 4N24]ESQ06235.1 hypothetical protein B590_10835 [Streptomyces sp. PVA_94-07]UZN59134.1 hypothetical protein B591N_10710 [Streptomyces sp. GBA 94-10 4N24]
MSATASLFASAYCCVYVQLRADGSRLARALPVAVGAVGPQVAAEAEHPRGLGAALWQECRLTASAAGCPGAPRSRRCAYRSGSRMVGRRPGGVRR